jgi:hypothetical protein
VDQPAVQEFVWTAAQKQLIQSRVEQIHTNWSTTANFMQPPTGGILATLGTGLIGTPPPGLGAGYVPIVIQEAMMNQSKTFTPIPAIHHMINRAPTPAACVELPQNLKLTKRNHGLHVLLSKPARGQKRPLKAAFVIQ